MPSRSCTHALAILAADHKAIGHLLEEFDELAGDRAGAQQRARLARRICQALVAHAVAEEEVFYPAARAALDDDELIDEALCEHDSVRALVEQVESLDADDPVFDATVLVLARAVAEHVRTEEQLLFPRVKAAGLDTAQLGSRLLRCRDEVVQLLGSEVTAG
jgi:hemerythrin superfamily protein